MENLQDRLKDIKKTFSKGIIIGSREADKNHDLLKTERLSSLLLSDSAFTPALSLVFDEEILPFKPFSFDLIINPLTLHWINDLPGALSQMKHSLEADGALIGALMGGESLRELKHVLLQAESEVSGRAYQRVAPLVNPAMMGGLLQRAGFSLPVIDIDRFTVSYTHILDLMHDLRGMGETHVLYDTPSLTRPIIERAHALYARLFSENNKLSATFEIIYFTGWSPHFSQQTALKPGAGQFLLQEAVK